MTELHGVLIDLGGVVYQGDSALPGAVEAVMRLRDSGLAVRFLTNTTRRSRSQLLGDLQAMGLEVTQQELFTPAAAARDWLEERDLAPLLVVHPNLVEDFAGLPQGDDAVVIGDAGSSFTYEPLNAAFRALMDGAEFLSLAENRYFRDSDGALSLDAGPFVAALAFASGKEALCMGKPAPAFFAAALASMGCTAAQAVMIGDDAEADVGGAMDAGLAAILVRTGKYQTGDEAAITPPPTLVAEDLAQAVETVLAGKIGG